MAFVCVIYSYILSTLLQRMKLHEIMNNFEAQYIPGFPRVIGLIDGTHIKIRAPTVQPDSYINRKKFHSLNTQVSFFFKLIFTVDES